MVSKYLLLNRYDVDSANPTILNSVSDVHNTMRYFLLGGLDQAFSWHDG